MRLGRSPVCFHRRPTVRSGHTPSTSGRRCQGWRRCGEFQQKRPRPSCPCRGQSLWMKVRWCSCLDLIHHRPTVLWSPLPSTSPRRCQGWRRCGNIQQIPQRLCGPCRARSLWMKVRWCPCWFHHRSTVRCCPIPNTSGRRCQGWRRCGDLQQKPKRPFGPCRGQSQWMKVR